MQQLLFLDSWNWNWEREREKERHTHTWWWCGCSNRFLIIVSSRCCFFLITHTDIWPVKWGRRRMTLSQGSLSPGWLYSITGRLFDIPFAPLPKILRSGFFFFFCPSRSLAFLVCPFFFLFLFYGESGDQTNKQKKRSKRRKWTQSVARRDSRFLFLHFL